jgi:hypothetical protein
MRARRTKGENNFLQLNLSGDITMVNVKKMIEGKYLAAKNAGEFKNKTVTIDAAFGEIVNDDEKVLLRLSGIEKPLVCNHTNLSILAASFGDDTVKWIGNSVIIGIVKVKYNGELVDSIQLSPVK